MLYPQAWYSDPVTLAQHVREAQHGERHALDRLLGELRPAFVAFFARRLPSDVAEDLAQNALLRVAKAIDRIDPERASAYLTTALRNLMRTARRQHVRDRNRHPSVDELVVDTRLVDADARTEYEELARAVYRVSTVAMPEPLAEIILGLLHGDTPAEIAERQGVSPITVRTRLMRARAILRRELHDHLSGLCSGARVESAKRHQSVV